MPHAILAHLSDDERSDYLATLTKVSYSPGDVLFQEGGPGKRFMFLVEGRASVWVHGTEIATVEPGSILGELAVLRGTTRSATVRAVDPVVGYEGTLEHLLDLFERSPEAAAELAEIRARRTAPLVPTQRIALRDGASVFIRPLLPTDTDSFMHVYDSWPPRKRYLRFFSATPPDHVLAKLIDIDFVDHFAWILFSDEAETDPMGSARYIRVDDPTSAQVAFGVAEEWQRRGVASALIAALGAAARVNGITTFTAEVLAENVAAQGLLKKFGMTFTWGVAGELVGTGPVADPLVALTPDEAQALAATASLVTKLQ